jgi:hypothetical protein
MLTPVSMNMIAFTQWLSANFWLNHAEALKLVPNIWQYEALSKRPKLIDVLL